MGLRFRKSFKVAPGVRFNVSTKSVGASFGGKGLRYSVNSSGRRTTTVGIPGSGVSYSSTSSSGRKYKSSAYTQRNEIVRRQKEIAKLQELERNQLEVEAYENKVEMIKSIHKECDDEVNWLEMKNTPSPFTKGEKGPNERIAEEKLNSYKPGFLSKILKQEEKKKKHLIDNIEKAKLEDQQDYLNWEELVETATNVLDGDIDTYFKVIEEFAPLDDLLEFGSGFEFFMEDPHSIEVEFNVHTESVVPTQVKSLTKTGKLSVKDMPKTKYYDIQQDYVCSSVIRIARDLFALLPLHFVYIHAFDEHLNTSTGHTEQVVILSVRIEKNILQTLNVETIDCSDAMQNFKHNMKFKKTKGFDPVEKLKIES
ncbi:DUF4236 domain-containing protein [Bacillus sp. PS06]|uniref:DUF4236 domain-containing protein n=1 Tax=Bacillus sp. PS06 TaxID=2764176 RepID=UPI0017827E50|nr:DUF4236 domain-containing protein [Bacillus sp. PS06]MBD8070686.1 DUF4236 domain-containing protein [Bacillus sp. PS06]